MKWPRIAELTAAFPVSASLAEDPVPKPAAPLRPDIVAAVEWGSKPQSILDAQKLTPKFVTIQHAGVT